MLESSEKWNLNRVENTMQQDFKFANKDFISLFFWQIGIL